MDGDKINVRIVNRKRVAMEETNLDVLVAVTVPAELSDPGVDIVTVLGVRPSRWDHDKKLEHLKASMESLIKQLRPIDRISVVTFSTRAQKLCPLNPMTAEAQASVELLVKNLADEPGSSESMSEALRMALQELNDNHSKGRMPVIFLISDSIDGDKYKDATQIPPCDVPVHSFFFCRCSEIIGIRKEAVNSNEGTCLYLDDSSKLEGQISRRWADVVTPLKDIKLTIRPVKVQIDDIEITTEIERVIDRGREVISEIVVIGNLPRKEEHKVMVKLCLPAVDEEVAMEVLQVTYSCRYAGKLYDGPPMMAVVTRTGQDLEEDGDEVVQYAASCAHCRFRRMAGHLPANITSAIGKATKIFNETKDSLKTLNDISHRVELDRSIQMIQLGGSISQSSPDIASRLQTKSSVPPNQEP